MLLSPLTACLPLDWTDSVSAATAALLAVIGTLGAKHRPAGARTRRDDVGSELGEQLERQALGLADRELPYSAPSRYQARQGGLVTRLLAPWRDP